MLDQALKFVLDVAFGLLTYAFLLRFAMQWLRAPFRNPLAQAVVALTDPVWKVCRIVYSGDNFVRKLWADGNTKFDNVFSDYLTLDYKSPV